ncbi:16S rRNA (guanine(527)-N(7))-methyltransferase RsmG [Mollicutes bacterium LVI A0078]|nr:16S rRNA (guanine(527)-N(7))-methyltransferase RsmG [Mollicutes bacterium LVI A0075]WOO90815.1 16S rRNA (guanine(527)-N(7))-methyltransferase RsmG [Mollicutes bacterium LVI A0078]
MELEFFKEIDSQLTDTQRKQYYRYFELIAEYNKVMNLTGIDDYEGVYLKHFFDSLTVKDQIIEINPETIADVGSGAGFPGIVLAIYFPEIKFTLIEPLTKRIKFLQVVVDELELTNVELLNERVEDIDAEFDIVTSRAVARLNILLELCAPVCKVGGYVLTLKGPKVTEELEEAKNAISKLGLEQTMSEKLVLPIEESVRYNVYLKKVAKTPAKYPRNFGQIKKKPL